MIGGVQRWKVDGFVVISDLNFSYGGRMLQHMYILTTDGRRLISHKIHHRTLIMPPSVDKVVDGAQECHSAKHYARPIHRENSDVSKERKEGDDHREGLVEESEAIDPDTKSTE